MGREINGTETAHTQRMLGLHITELARQIGRKWFLPLEQLAERAGVFYQSLQHVLRGEEILPYLEERLRNFLDNYKGECL